MFIGSISFIKISMETVICEDLIASSQMLPPALVINFYGPKLTKTAEVHGSERFRNGSFKWFF